MKRLILAIDPGLTGAFVLLNPEERQINVILDMPVVIKNGKKLVNGRAISDWLTIYEPRIDISVIEGVHSMPRDGHVGAFSFGKGVGIVMGALAAHGLEPINLDPAAWKSGMGLGRDKNQSRARAEEFFPNQAAAFLRKRDDGRAEAALMAVFAARTLGRWR